MALCACAGFVAWKGPSAALRWAVRTWDPALRLRIDKSIYHDGEWVLRGVALELRGRRDPVFRSKEIRAGLGSGWMRGKIGALRLVEPIVHLDKVSLAHFSRGSSGQLPITIGKVSIERGHIWLENAGEQGLEVSADFQGEMSSIGPGSSGETRELAFSNVYVAARDGDSTLPVLGADRAGVRFTLDGLLAGRLAGARIEGGWMVAGEGLRKLMADSGHDGGNGGEGGFVLESLDIVKMQLQPDGLPGGLPELRLRVNTALRNVPLGAVTKELAQTVHQIEFSDVELLSPTDPLRRAVTIRSLFVKFTLEGLARRDLEELIVLGPTVYVGEPLFEYMQGADKAAGPPQPDQEWNVDKLQINFGRVVIAVGGRSQVGLPLAFHTSVTNLSLSSLAGLNVELVLTVPTEDYDFPAYDLSLSNVRGDLRFNYPPAWNRNNLVNVIKFDRARWRNFHASELWLSVTYDEKGINGLFGGRAYRGYVNGGFSFFLQPDSPWTGWVAGTSVDLDPLTADGVPQHVVMDGRSNFKLEANGRAAVVERVSGSAAAKGKGRLVVNKLNDMLAAIPAEWSALKSELTRVSLETLRDFDYTKASSDFWFVGKQGIINVNMKGPAGSRNLEMVFHGRDTAKTARWQQGGRR
ncbi:MAG: hypothetical protein FGM15_00880 [Chthoniobacterales bacterium]|nr:hypothetical protein [Chthoniobacterales bacterium]